MRHMDFVGEDDETLHGAIPQYFALSEREPREDAQVVGKNEPVYRQVAPDGYQAVFLHLNESRVGENDFVSKSVNHLEKG